MRWSRVLGRRYRLRLIAAPSLFSNDLVYKERAVVVESRSLELFMEAPDLALSLMATTVPETGFVLPHLRRPRISVVLLGE